MIEGCNVIETLNSMAPVFTMFAAIASALAIFNANEISRSVRDFQQNIILNQREIELIGKTLEKLAIYEIWCKSGGTGEGVNYHDSNEVEYASRDEAFVQIPIDVKFLLIQLSSRSVKLESQLTKWENGFIKKVGNSYLFEEHLISEKIQLLREIRAGGLYS